MNDECIALSESFTLPPSRRKYIFLVANPLQILMSVSIIRQLCIARESLMIITGGFTDAHKICSRFSPQEVGAEGLSSVFSETRDSAFAAIECLKPSELFVDGDVGFKNFRLLRRIKSKVKGLRVNVFEEGIGTYRADLYSGPKRWIFQSFGIATHFGGSSLTDKIFLLEPHRYRLMFTKDRVGLVHLTQGPDEVLSSYFDAWATIFGYQSIEQGFSSECSLYLSAWDFRVEAVGRFYRSSGDRFIKLHPRCSDEVCFPGAAIIGDAAPAEMVVADLANRYSIVRIFHHGSSVEQYLSRENVVFERV